MSRQRRSAVYISLAHNHIPKLVDAGIIYYDATREHIKEIDLERLEPTLSTVTGVDTK